MFFVFCMRGMIVFMRLGLGSGLGLGLGLGLGSGLVIKTLRKLEA